MPFASPNIRTEWSRHGTHCAVRVSGGPALNEFFSFLSWLSIETEGWSVDRLLLDLREVRSLRDPQDQSLAGNALGIALRHVDRIASVVPRHVATGEGRCEPLADGVARSVFRSERKALDWLLRN